eukprot:augustus_masked-scaffold_19-processed-gene-4.34-mRNA-1 protein AED:1.00 eAED:1.00 QI:0/-1/0/0/-1/1/1/0/486
MPRKRKTKKTTTQENKLIKKQKITKNSLNSKNLSNGEPFNETEIDLTSTVKAQPAITELQQPIFLPSEFAYDYDEEPQLPSSGVDIRKILSSVPKNEDLPEESAQTFDFLQFEESTPNKVVLRPTKHFFGRAPWLRINDENRVRVPNDPLIFLHNEILEFYQFISSSEKEEKIRQKAFDKISTVIIDVYPHATVKLFGSIKTGLALPGSDIDINVKVFEEEEKQVEALNRVGKKIQYEMETKYLELIPHARIPIIKVELEIEESGESFVQQIDIAFGTTISEESDDRCVKFLEKYPLAKPLTLVLKYFFQQRSLSDTFRGGIGSHLTLLTVIFTMQHFRKKIMFNSRYRGQKNTSGDKFFEQQEDLGSLLLEYFNLFSRDLNSERLKISVLKGGLLTKKIHQDPNGTGISPGWGHITLLNPDNEELDVGSAFYMHTRYRKAFQHAFFMLCRGLKDFKGGRKAWSILDRIIKVDDKLKARFKTASGV